MNGLYDELRIAIHGVWRRRWLALGVAWGLCLLGWLVVAMIPNAYESQARVFVQLQSILPDKIGVSMADQQRDVDRVRQTLASTVNLEKVVRGTDLSLTVSSDRDVADRVESLRKAITVVAQQDNLFQITARSASGGLSDAENAKLSRAIVQKLIDIFVEENLAGGRDETNTTLKFLDGQLAQRAKQLQDAETKKIQFESEYMGSLPGTGSIGDRIDAARTEINKIDTDLAAATSALAAVNGQMAATPASVSSPGYGGGGSAGPARSRLSGLENQLADARAKGWTDQHPDVVSIRNQMTSARSAASSERVYSGGGGASANPLYVSLRSMQADRQATAAALSARKAQLTADMSAFVQHQTADPAFAEQASRVQRDYSVLKDQYDKILADREEVKLRGQMESQTDSVKFRVIDPPSAPRKPIAPNRPMLLTLVLLAGIGGGVGAAFAMGQVRTTYPTAPRLERASGLPVIGSIGAVVTEAMLVERARWIKYFAGGSAALGGAYALLLLVEFVQRGMVA